MNKDITMVYKITPKILEYERKHDLVLAGVLYDSGFGYTIPVYLSNKHNNSTKANILALMDAKPVERSVKYEGNTDNE